MGLWNKMLLSDNFHMGSWRKMAQKTRMYRWDPIGYPKIIGKSRFVPLALPSTSEAFVPSYICTFFVITFQVVKEVK